MFDNNLIALALTIVIALAWLRLNDFFAHKGWISSTLSRKIIHIGTGPIFVLCWLFFNDSPSSPFIASLVPLGITTQFALVGTGVIKDPAAVEAMSRTGDRKEILYGPLFYGIVFVILTVLFWRTSPVGMVALMILCGGDGLADVLGKKIRSFSLPWSRKKTIVGSITMFFGGLLFSSFIISVFTFEGYLPGSLAEYFPVLVLIAFVAMVVESLPFSDIDNLTVPLVSVIMGLIFLR